MQAYWTETDTSTPTERRYQLVNSISLVATLRPHTTAGLWRLHVAGGNEDYTTLVYPADTLADAKRQANAIVADMLAQQLSAVLSAV